MAELTNHICRPQTLQGAIVPLSWDKAHHAKSFGIYTEQGSDVLIEQGSVAKVQGHLHNLVRVSGMVCLGPDGQEFIRIEHVENYAALPSFLRD